MIARITPFKPASQGYKKRNSEAGNIFGRWVLGDLDFSAELGSTSLELLVNWDRLVGGWADAISILRDFSSDSVSNKFRFLPCH